MIRAFSPSELEAFRNARAEAWRFALACLAENRSQEKKAAGPRQAGDLEDERKNQHALTHPDCT